MDARPQRWVIDAIEEDVASIEIEGGRIITVPCAILPAGVKPSDVLSVVISIDAAATRQALADSAAQVEKGRDASLKRDKGGDIAL